MASKKTTQNPTRTETYRHPMAEALLRPDVGTQAQFRKKKPHATYRYDSSLDPAMSWDEGNEARENGEGQIAELLERIAKLGELLASADGDGLTGAEVEQAKKKLAEAQNVASRLKAMSAPFLNWSGKAERSEFEVPTLPLFVHERLSTSAVIDTLRGHKKGAEQLALFADPQHSITDQVLKAYEFPDEWVNRMILGDSMVVMNSLLHYEGMAGQVQMIYMDPPYGIKFGSNFQSFVRKRDVKHGDDDHMTYEPEMVQAYRDTWELGLHSYLTYMRDRLFLCRDLLHSSGSIFVQISDENLHHVKELIDEIFGHENACGLIAFRTTGGQSTSLLSTSTDFLLWYAKDKGKARDKFHNPTKPKVGGINEGSGQYTFIEPIDGSEDPRPMSTHEEEGKVPIPEGWRILAHDTLYSQGASPDPKEREFVWRKNTFQCPANTHWKPGVKSGGMDQLSKSNRLMLVGKTLRYKRYVEDYPVYLIDNIWNDTAISGFARKKEYVVETSTKVAERCLLMTTDPGDLVLDPTCGSGTTAYVAEQWGRRWITTDVSRVPLALARQRLLTATYKYYELRDESRGPTSGFVYKRKQNRKGEEIGGIVPHITLKSIANNEPPAEEVLVDKPEVVRNITRVTGPFVVEATIPTPMDWEQEDTMPLEIKEDQAAFGDRMLEVLRKVKTLRLAGNRKVELKNVRLPAKTLSLSAEAIANGENGGSDEISGKPVAFVFGPENGAVSEHLVFEAAREAHGKDYAHLFVLGFGIEPNARMLVEKCNDVMGIPATYVEATRDLMMGDLLKNMRSSQVFSVCGLPEVDIKKDEDGKYHVKLLGIDVFDPVTMTNDSRPGDDVPAWFLDTDYNGKVFHVCQAFFPRTNAWDNLKKAIKTDYSSEVWDHLAGAESAPFEGGEHGRIAVKVIDDRGNELMVVKDLKEAK